jgi:hypothetical protein
LRATCRSTRSIATRSPGADGALPLAVDQTKTRRQLALPAWSQWLVSRVLFAERVTPLPRDDHSSTTRVAACLERPTQGLGRATLRRPSTWPCSGWGLPCRNRYRLRGGLLPHHFTLTRRRSEGDRLGRFVFCGTFLEVILTGRYPASCPVEPGLSSQRKRAERSPELLRPL